MKILIVRDHFVVCERLRRLCIRQAASTPDALIAVHEDQPHSGLLDSNSPNSLDLF